MKIYSFKCKKIKNQNSLYFYKTLITNPIIFLYREFTKIVEGLYF